MIEIDLNVLFDEVLKHYQRERSKPRIDPATGQPRKWSTKGKIYISTLLATDCDKQLRWIFDGAETDPIVDEWPGLENEIGTLVHDLIQKSLLQMGGVASIEHKISIEVEGVKINMKTDGLFANGNVLEMKTLGPKDYDLKMPREKDVMQANFYLGILSKPKAIVSYFKRDNGKHIKSFQIDFDREKYKKVITRIVNIIRDKNLRFSKRSCRFCKYTKHCKEKGRPW